MEEFAVVDLESHHQDPTNVLPVITPEPLYSDAVDTLTAAVECSDLDCDHRVTYDTLSDADVIYELSQQ